MVSCHATMKVDVKKLPKSELLITVEVDADKMPGYEELAAKRISENVDIPGFRKGQAPKAFIMSHVGPEAFFQETLNVALPRSYFDAISENKLEVISRPDVKIVSRSPLKYEARVAVMPEITVKAYEKIKIPAKNVEVTDAELNEVVEEMRRYRATYKPIERPIQKGDRIEIDFQGFDKTGVPLENTKSSNHPLFLGEGSLVAGFEDALLGMKVGEKKKFPVTFPKDYHFEPMRNKEVNFETEVKRAEETVLPELNEDFVSAVMGAPRSIAEFKDALKKDIVARKQMEDRRNRENELLEKLLKESKLDVPPILIQEEVDYMMEDLKKEVEERGLDFKTYLEKLKEQKRDVLKEYEPEADKRIRVRLILNYLFRQMKIEVSDDEVQMATAEFIKSVPENDRAKTQEDLNKKGELYMRLKNNLMLTHLFANFLD